MSTRTLHRSLHDEITDLHRMVEGLSAALLARRRRPVDDQSDNDLRHLHDELASHLLAVQVLVSSGASEDAIGTVLQRARRLLAHPTPR